VTRVRRRLSGLATVTAALLVCLGGSPAPAQAGDASRDTVGIHVGGAQWHRLHPLLCHTAGDHQPR
jgi:hypothetical protein